MYFHVEQQAAQLLETVKVRRRPKPSEGPRVQLRSLRGKRVRQTRERHGRQSFSSVKNSNDESISLALSYVATPRAVASPHPERWETGLGEEQNAFFEEAG